MKGSRSRCAAVGLALVLLLARPPRAESQPAPPPGDTGDYRISLITILPGRSLYSAFGHTAVRVVDTRRGRDLLFNYGLSAHPFDLAFAANMAVGRMEFMVAALHAEETLAYYRDEENRTIIEQELDLDPERTRMLLQALERDVRPENSVYNYRYFTDNCATRVWALLAPIVGKQPAPGPTDPAPTIRNQLRETVSRRPWLMGLLDIMLGPRADRAIDPDAPLFLPRQLMDWLAAAREPGAAGKSLVKRTATLYEVQDTAGPGMAVGPSVAAALILALSLAMLARVPPRAALVHDSALFAAAAALWAAVAAVWLLAGYPELAFNLNLLWASPLPLVALLAGRRDGARAFARALYALTAAGAVLIAALGGLGVQDIPLAPRLAALALALRCADRIRRGPMPGRQAERT